MKRSVSKKLNQETLLESALKNGPQRELKTAWDSLGQAKSILRQVDSKMTDMSMPSSADVLWNLPDFLYCLVDQENLNKTAKPDTENESERNESVSDVETKVSRRKVSCWDNTKADSNIEDRSISSSPRNAGVNGKFSSSKRASLDKRVANSATDSTLFSVGDSSLHPQSSLWNGSSRNDESNANSTSCSAVRDTEIRFLNDDVVAERKPLSQEAPQPPRLHRVDVIVRDDCNETGSFGHSQNLKKAPPQEPASSDGLDNLKSILKHREMEFASSHIPFDKVSDETLNVPRKVAYAPSATVYRGFNRPLVHVKSLPLKAEWMRDNLSANNNSVDDRPQEPVADVVPDLFVAADVPSKKFGRVVAVGNNELAKKDVIRTDSWRAGAKLQRELGLTYSARPKSRSTIDQNSSARSKQTGGKEATAIPEEGEIPDDVLKDRLKDILTAKEEEKKESVKAKARKKKKSRSPTPENRKEKVTKVILYDASAARKYIRKQKEQRRREKMEKKEAETRMKAEKQQRLEDLSKRQHEAAMKSRRREPVEINNEDQWMNMKNMLNMKATLSIDEDSDDDDEEEEEEEEEENSEVGRCSQSERFFLSSQQRQQQRPTVDRIANGTRDAKTGRRGNDDDLSAQEIVNQFAIKSGLTLDDVVTNYAKYADEIIRSFVTKDVEGHGSKLLTAQRRVDGKIFPLVNSRLESILRSSNALQSRIRAETRKITTDPVMQFDADNDTNSKSLLEANSSTHIHDDVVFDTDLPGFKARAFPVGSQSEKTLPSSVTVSENVDLKEKQGVLSEKTLPVCVSKDESCPFYLRPPLAALQNKSDVLFVPPSKPVPVWNSSAAEPDPLSILNIFSRKHREVKIRHVDEEVLAKRLKIEGVRNESEARPGKEVMIPGRDTSAGSSGRESFLANSPRGPMPGNRLENMAIEMDDDNNVDDDDDDESRSSGQPFLTERSDPWPTTQRSDAPGSPSVTPRSEVLTFRSDTDSYSADFTDVHNKTDVSGDDEIDRDHLESHSTAVPGFDDSRRTSSHHRGPRERDEVEISADSSSHVTPLTDSEIQNDGEDMDLSEVTSITPVSGLTNQLTGQGLPLHPLMGGWIGQPILGPAALEARMLAELNLLESMDEVLLQVSGMERTRSVAMAHQETVSIAQVLKARQQTQSQEVEAARVKLEKEGFDEMRRLQARLTEASDKEHDAAIGRMKATAEAMSSLQESMVRLTQTQTDAAQLTAEAAVRLSERRRSSTGRDKISPATDLERKSSRRGSEVMSGRRSQVPSTVRSDRSSRSERSQSRLTSAQTSENESGSETVVISTKRSRRQSSVSTEAGIVDGVDMSRPVSSQSLAVESDIRTESEMSKVSRNTRAGGGESQRTKSVATGTDVSTNENTLDESSVSTEPSARRRRSIGSRTSKTTEQVESEKDYEVDYDSSSTEDELDKSLREIIPSESQRKKIKNAQLKLNLSSGSELTATNGASSNRQSTADNSFEHFNILMVQQYLKDETVRHQHKQTLLRLREEALKEKTAAELAWLERQKLKLQTKGSDDRYPELSKKQTTILRKHKKYQAELNRLKEANQSTLEAQKLLLTELHRINKLQKSVKEVKARLKNADNDSLSDLDITTDLDTSISQRLKKDEVDGTDKGKDSAKVNKDYQTNEILKTADRKGLIEHEQKLRRELMKYEMLLKLPNKTEEIHEKNSKNSNKIIGKKRTVSPTPQNVDSARSVATASDAALNSVRSESNQSRQNGSIAEELTTERSSSTRNRKSSVTEEISTARSHSAGQPSSEEVEDDVSEMGKASSGASISQKSVKNQHQASSEGNNTKTRSNRNRSQEKSAATDSEIDFTLNQSVDFSGRSKIEAQIKNLTEELKRRKAEAKQLEKERQKKNLVSREEKLRQSLKLYNSFIEEAKNDLKVSSSSSDDTEDRSGIGSPRSQTKHRKTETRSKQALTSDRGKDSNDSRPPSRHSTVTEEISENVSTAAVSATFEKVHLDLDLDVPGERERRLTNQSLTPRSSRVPESARTLDDIPEDLIESRAQSRSEADTSGKTSSRRSQTDGSNPLYADDFSSTARDKTKEKRSSEESRKSRSSVSDTDGSSTEGDISEEIPLASDSHSESEIEEVKDVQIIVENNDVPSAVVLATVDVEGTISAKDGGQSNAIGTVTALPEEKTVDFEKVTETTLDMLLNETMDEFFAIKKRKAMEKDLPPELKPQLPSSPATEQDNTVKKQGPPSTEPIVIVPHDTKDIKSMVDSAVDILWNNRDGSDASWDKIQYKMDLGKKDDLDEEDELAAKNKASYRHLVFDLTAEALCTTYMDDKRPVEETTPWPCLGTAKGVRCRVKPTGLTAEHVKPTIQQHVLRRLGLADDKTEPSRPLKFRKKRRCQPKKSEQLDELVLQDLQEEESDWIDYSLDELNVKMELADSIFNSIVQETVALMTTVKSRHRFE